MGRHSILPIIFLSLLPLFSRAQERSTLRGKVIDAVTESALRLFVRRPNQSATAAS